MQRLFRLPWNNKLVQGLLAVLTAIFILAFSQHSVNITVDFATRVPVNSMSGILHGVDAKNPPDNMIKPLQAKLWRLGGFAAYNRVLGMGAQPQIMISDLWGYGSNPNGFPYQNFAAWETFVRNLAQEHKGKRVLWDIWNEPDEKTIFWKGTREQFFETYKRAYLILRQVLGPDAIIGGPSLMNYNKDSIVAFLDYCKANKLEVNFLSWHELDDRFIYLVDDHLIDARRNFVQSPSYKELKIKKLYVNEIVGDLGQYRPGEILGYFYYLEQGNADGACRACWGSLGANKVSNCFNNTLAGMVAPDTFEPRAAWWAYKAYADGVGSRVISRSDNQRAIALASRSNPSGKAQVLVGYFDRTSPIPMVGITLTLRNLQQIGVSDRGQVRIKVEKIPNTEEGIVKSLTTVKEETLSVTGGTTQYFLPNVGLHEAYLVTLGKAPTK